MRVLRRLPGLHRLVRLGGVAAVLLLAPAPSAGGADASSAVFLLQVVRHDAGLYQPVVFGTAFFISDAGAALTNSHVVYLAHRYPERYGLLAVVGREFYSASVICARSRSPARPRRATAGPRCSMPASTSSACGPGPR